MKIREILFLVKINIKTITLCPSSTCINHFLQQSTLMHGYTFCGFSYSWSAEVQKYSMEDLRNRQFVSFTLCATLCSLMKSTTFLLHPIQDLNHPFIQSISPISHLIALQVRLLDQLSWYHSVYVHVTFILLNNGLQVQEQRSWQLRYAKEKL